MWYLQFHVVCAKLFLSFIILNVLLLVFFAVARPQSYFTPKGAFFLHHRHKSFWEPLALRVVFAIQKSVWKHLYTFRRCVTGKLSLLLAMKILIICIIPFPHRYCKTLHKEKLTAFFFSLPVQNVWQTYILYIIYKKAWKIIWRSAAQQSLLLWKRLR